MGGAALNKLGITVKRIQSVAEYEELRARAQAFLEQRFELIVFAREPLWKTSFGDIDVYVANPIAHSAFAHSTQCEHFAEFPKVVNGDTTSILFEGAYQLDIHILESAELRMAELVHYGDLCMCIGLLLHKTRVKMCHTGFYLRSNGLLLTKDPDQVIAFLGLPPIRYDFATPRDMFEYILSAPFDFFNTLDKSWRKHFTDERRPIFDEFLTYMDECMQNGTLQPRPAAVSENERDIAVAFGKQKEYDVIIENEARKKRVHDKFNGKIVGALTGLTQKELGEFMKYLRTLKTFDELHDMSETEIRTFVMDNHV